jgi:hypothetical protein
MFEAAPLIAGFTVAFASRAAWSRGYPRSSRILLIALFIGVAASGLAGEWVERPWLAAFDVSTALLGTIVGTVVSLRWVSRDSVGS